MAFTMSVRELIAADTSGLLGRHPSWERVPLADIASIVNGAPFDSEHFSATEGKPLVRIRDVTAGATATYYTGPYEDVYLVRRGDLLIGMDGDFNSGFWASGEALLNQRVCRISPDESYYDKRLLAYALPGYLSAINANTPSVTVKHLSSKTIGQIELPLPPRAEQARIVAKLEELLSDLDAGVAELKAAQKKLQQYRQSLLKAAVEGALTADWRKAQRQQGTPTEAGAQLLARILTERRARWEARQVTKYKEQGKVPPRDWQRKYSEPAQAVAEDLPALPETWTWATAEQLCDFITKGTTPPKEVDDGSEQDVPFLRVTNLTDSGRLDLSDRVFVSASTHKGFLARSVVYPNDVLMNIVGPPLGQVSVVPNDFPEWNVNQAIAIFRAVDGVEPLFMRSYLLSPVARTWLKTRAKTTAGQTNLTLELCRYLPVPLPPKVEQMQIVHQINENICGTSDQESAIQVTLRRSVAQRSNILRAAFAGDLVPQDPDDEPASSLLERIRIERSEGASKRKVPKTRHLTEA